MKHILFVDVRNAIRSRMAEVWFNDLANGYGVAASCGTMPAAEVDPRAAQVMREVRLDIEATVPAPVSQQRLARADIVVLMGKDICPQAFAPTYIWDFREPQDPAIGEMRCLRDQIREKVQELIADLEIEELDSITTTLQWQALMENILSR